ncbi:MAG: M18 family aminopeptidase [Wujia sp.]
MNDLLYYLQKGKTQFHVAELARQYLKEQGFQELSLKDLKSELPAGRYFVSPFSSMVVPFVKDEEIKQLRIAGAHTDFPMLKIKPNPDMTKQGYRQLNVEPYGGLIKETWFDRPLGLAGKVVCKGDSAFSPKVHLFDSEKPVCIIPNLAPHLKRGGKDGEMDVQKELIPLTDMPDDSKTADSLKPEEYLLKKVAEKLQVPPESILDYDLYLYIYDSPQNIGFEENLVSAPRIDNISSVCAILHGLVAAADTENNTLMLGALFDNEEIGSRSKQGADSLLLREILDALLAGSDCSLTENGFYLSVDVAHATHPNYSERSDITTSLILGKGVAIKTSSSQRYVCDSEAGAVISDLCMRNNIKLQRTVNRSGMPGGQTLGPILSSYLPMRACDIGIPVLAMHSARELMHRFDYEQLLSLLTCFFSTGK